MTKSPDELTRAVAANPALAGVLEAGRVLGAAAVFFHSAVAARLGLSVVESKTLDVLVRGGPHTAGEIAQSTGLAPSSVTSLIDRLARKGFVERLADKADGRRVRVAAVADKLREAEPLFADFMTDLLDMSANYSAAEMTVIARYMSEAARIQQDSAAKLVAGEI